MVFMAGLQHGKGPRGSSFGSFKAIFSSMLEQRRIVHFHFFHVGMLQMIQVLLARLFLRKVVITAHDVESFVENLEVPALSRWVYRQADRVIAHNRISRQELINRIGLSEDKITVIPHGNYLHAIRPMPEKGKARQTLKISAQAKVLLFFGQIKEVKGLGLLLEAMPEVLEAHPDIVLLIAGKPWKCEFTEYEKRMDNLGIHGHCLNHIRFIPDVEVPNYYASADLVVLPYRRIYQSGVLLMAMSYCKAVVVSDLPGMTEIVTDGTSGYVFRQGNAEDLAHQLCLALEDSVERDRRASQGFQLVLGKYDWKIIGEKTKAVYASIVDDCQTD